MKKLAMILILITAAPARAGDFEPYYVGQGSYWVSTNPFESDASIAKKVARFCESKGLHDYAMGIRTTDIFSEQNFVCLHEGATAEPAYPNAGPAIIGVIPY